MTCYNPLVAYKLDGKVVFHKPFAFAKGFNLPCGQCIGCRLEYSRQWAVRCVHEAQMHDENCFITLTFNNDALKERRNPYSLDKTEFQKFMKRVRKRYAHKIRFFHCGEYGEKNNRPHYHALMFGHDFRDKKLWSINGGNRLYISQELQELWPYGFNTIGEVNFETAAYTARYVMKKHKGDDVVEKYQITDEDGVIWDRIPEYCTMSRGRKKDGDGGIGYRWYLKYGWSDCHKHDYVVVNGHETRPPRFYDKLCDEKVFEKIKQKRVEEAPEPIINYNENMDRLWVKEEVKKISLDRSARKL